MKLNGLPSKGTVHTTYMLFAFYVHDLICAKVGYYTHTQKNTLVLYKQSARWSFSLYECMLPYNSDCKRSLFFYFDFSITSNREMNPYAHGIH